MEKNMPVDTAQKRFTSYDFSKIIPDVKLRESECYSCL